MALLLKEDQ
uniref:Uncharacterized protein n=1 Tax=Arundo donax TaxID=35708 RepID=A0A0A9HQA4_ARUDO